MSSWLKTAFDIDGVFAQTDVAMITVANEKFGLNLEWKDWTYFSMEKSFGVSKEMVREIIDITLHPDYAASIPINHSGIRMLKQLYESYEKPIMFITSRKNEEYTRYFLDNYMVVGKFQYELRTGSGYFEKTTPERKIMHLNETRCIAILDDGPENCKEIRESGFVTLLYDQPYNRYAARDWYTMRVSTWKEICNISSLIEDLCRSWNRC